REIPDFPKPGILFRDITPLLANPGAFTAAIEQMAEHYAGEKVDTIVAAEARGVIFAAPLAIRLQAAFVPIRKPGKLPFATHAFRYELDAATAAVETHVDGVRRGQRVFLVADLRATGATVDACCPLLETTGAERVGCAFLIERKDLGGAQRLGARRV